MQCDNSIQLQGSARGRLQAVANRKQPIPGED